MNLENPMATKFNFDSSEYKFSHGHSPRGRGSWAFEVSPTDVDVALLKRSVDRFNDSPPRVGVARVGVARLDATTYGGHLLLLWLPSSTFTEAKRLAKAIVRHASYVFCTLRVAS
jgi:hypothetical protein